MVSPKRCVCLPWPPLDTYHSEAMHVAKTRPRQALIALRTFHVVQTYTQWTRRRHDLRVWVSLGRIHPELSTSEGDSSIQFYGHHRMHVFMQDPYPIRQPNGSALKDP